MTAERAAGLARLLVGSAAILKTVPLALAGLGLPVLAVWIVLSALVASGAVSRLASASLSALGFYLLLSGFYSNHLYLLSSVLLLLAVSDCQRAFAIRPRRSGGSTGWPLVLMRFQLSIVYGYAGLAKILGDWPDGGFVLHIQANASIPVPDLIGLAVPMSWAVILLEIGIALAVWFRGVRWVAAGVAIPLHLGMLIVGVTPQVFLELIVFALLMAALFVPFFTPFSMADPVGGAESPDPATEAAVGRIS
ncbi:hypothetical protein BH23GEM11_BH23GEM11_08580 [soil metagenome]